jgi:AcrR family transcriptional regulator
MANPYMRKKQPELVRQSIVAAAKEIAVTQGAAAMTIQAVAAAAGVTKGGLLHHFPSRTALTAAVLTHVLETFDAEIDSHLAPAPGSWGRFTRAYIDVLLMGKRFGVGSPFDALFVISIAEPDLATRWNTWLSARIERHKSTDDDPKLEIVRLAVDGTWLSYFGRAPDAQLVQLCSMLTAMTHR